MNSRLVVCGLVLAALVSGCKRMKAPEFDLARVDAKGRELAAGDTAPGACVVDRKTGLTWEVKTAEGLQAARHTYTWFNPDDEVNNGHPGFENGGVCAGSRCDTLAYVQAVNKVRLCGFNDWRLPRRDELGSLVDYAVPFPGPMVPKAFFPTMPAEGYWTGTPYKPHYSGVWAWRFDYGYDFVAKKEEPQHIILVRGEVKQPQAAE